MEPSKITASLDYINSILGLKLTAKEVTEYLKRSRLDAKIDRENNNNNIDKYNKKKSSIRSSSSSSISVSSSSSLLLPSTTTTTTTTTTITCTVPRYRLDITHPIDIAEEVAIGYGIFNIEPTFPASHTAGQKNLLSRYSNAIRETMTGIGMLEVLNFSLTSKDTEYDSFEITQDKETLLSVDSSKSSEHEILRESLIPSLLQSLSRNVHEEYPQKLFEIGKTFHQEENDAKQEINEVWNVGAVVAHGEASYTEIKSIMQALFKTCFGKDVTTKATKNPFYIEGRCSEIIVDNKTIGTVGEITPIALENFRLRVPVTAFEVNLSLLQAYFDEQTGGLTD
jgi:phenylalanyl-tRNA synthetase beta chain